MKNSLTKTELQLMHSVRKKWLDHFFDKTASGESNNDIIDFCYSLAELNPPLKIRVDSPLAAQYAANLFNSSQVWNQVWNQVSDQVRNQVYSQVWNQVWNQVRDQVSGQVNDQVRNQVYSQVWNQVWNQVRDQVNNQVSGQVYNQVNNYIDFGYRGSSFDLGWVSFYDFFEQIGIVKYKNFSKYKLLIHSSNIFLCVQLKGVCIYCEYPTHFLRDERNRLHNTDGPAIKFNDGYEQFFIHGRSVPRWIFDQKSEITKDQFLNENNAEIKAAIYEVLGQERMFKLLSASEVARSSKNNEQYILYKTHNNKYAWVGVQCPSTATKYLLGVPSDTQCPIQGVAGTWGLSASEYQISKHT